MWRRRTAKEKMGADQSLSYSPYPDVLLSVPRHALRYLSAALIDVDERTSRLPSGLRSATRYWMPRSAHWVRLISLSPSSFTK